MSAEFALPLRQLCGTVRQGEGRRKIEVKTGVYSSCARNCRSSRGVLHKDHGAYRGQSATKKAFKGPIRSLVVSSPVVSVHDEQAGVYWSRQTWHLMQICVANTHEDAARPWRRGALLTPKNFFSRSICSRLWNAINSWETGRSTWRISDHMYPHPTSKPPTTSGLFVI